MGARHAMREDERAWAGRQHHVDGPLSEVLRDDSPQTLGGERVVGEYILDVRVTHSERLMAAIDQLLNDAGWSAGDLEGLAVAVGPGSFTGLRVGLSTVKGLALALSIPVAAVPTLDAMAAMLPFA